VDEDLKEIARFVENYTEEFNASHDKVKMYITFNFFNMLKARLAMLYKNGGIGLLLVIIVLGFFLSIRLSFWVAFGIPASFLGMFIVGSLYGITINMISLFGMILVVGILVDDGIVIAENIYAHFERGKSPRKAAVDGALEVLPAVLTSVTTTMVAFSPVLIIKEGGMEFMHEMAFVVIAVWPSRLWRLSWYCLLTWGIAIFCGHGMQKRRVKIFGNGSMQALRMCATRYMAAC
jgi:multidrug efflux pump subunit AcrB